MRYLSVCSGIEAATVAWHPLGWRAAAYSEIEAFPRAVLAHHYPTVPLHGDFTTIEGTEYGAIDILVGGTPCQAFSVAGLRKGFADDRGNLTLEYLRLADRTQPRWLVWENVPGVLSIDGGRAFGAFLGGLAQLGYGFAYRVLDAQYAGVPQRRRRVFVVGYLGDWRRAAAVLFERESLSGNPAPRREAREGFASSSRDGLAATLGAKRDGGWRGDLDNETYVAFDLRGREGGSVPEGAHDTANIRAASGGSSRSYIAFSSKDHGADAGDTAPTLRAMGHSGSHANAGGQAAVAWSIMPQNSGKDYKARAVDVAQPLMSGAAGIGNQGGDIIQSSAAVRRLTPRECERLQGFPDDYTLIPVRGKPAADGPRYRALGNSMAVPVMAWIGQRIQMVESILDGEQVAA